MARNIVGNVPEPDELYGRAELIERVWRQLDGNNILLLAPRRFGKTGVMNHILGRPREGWLPIYLDVEDVDSPAEFVRRLTGEVLAHDVLRRCLHKARGTPGFLREWLRDTFDEVEFEGAKAKFKDSLPAAWQDGARRLVVELEKSGPTVIFILDELPSMLSRFMAKQEDGDAREFLAWFRTVRLLRKDTLRRHRFIVAGSTCIDVMLRKLDLAAAMNDFERIYVQPLEREDALKLLGELGGPLDLPVTDALASLILDRIGPAVPYFIHMFLSQLAQLPPARRRALSAAAVEEVYRQSVLGPTCKHYFDHYRTRLGGYGKELEACAMAVLREIVGRGKASASSLYDVYSKCRKRKASDTEFAELMADLECDWYVILDGRTNEYSFMLNVMRDWWQRWYGSPRARRPAAEGV